MVPRQRARPRPTSGLPGRTTRKRGDPYGTQGKREGCWWRRCRCRHWSTQLAARAWVLVGRRAGRPVEDRPARWPAGLALPRRPQVLGDPREQRPGLSGEERGRPEQLVALGVDL